MVKQKTGGDADWTLGWSFAPAILRCADCLALALHFPLIQIDTSPSGFTWSVDREEGLNAFAFTADGKGAENSVPALWSFF
jgi:hypothetical protein